MEQEQRAAFGLQPRESRTERGLSQKEFGLPANSDRTYIGGIKRRTRKVRIINAFLIAKALNVLHAELFSETKAR